MQRSLDIRLGLRVSCHLFQKLRSFFDPAAGISKVFNDPRHILAGAALISLDHDVFHLAGRIIHPYGHCAHLLHHQVDLLLVSYRHISHDLAKSVHIIADITGIDKTITH